MKRMLAPLLAVAVLVCMAQLMFAKDKNREYQDGELLRHQVSTTTQKHVWIDQHGKEITSYNTHSSHHSLIVQVGDMTYVGTTDNVSLNPLMKVGNWTQGSVKVRFERKSSLGVSVTFMYVQRQGEDGELKTRIIDIFDENGKNHCGLMKC